MTDTRPRTVDGAARSADRAAPAAAPADRAGLRGLAGRVRRRTVVLVVAGVVAAALLLTWLIAFSPVFGVRTVTVVGARTLGADRVRAVADVGHGTPLVRVDTAAVTRRVEDLPDVASAQVSTSFPSTVTITVVERVAVGYLDVPSGHVLVDAAGTRYRTVAKTPDLPRIVGPTGSAAGATTASLAHVAASLSAGTRTLVTSVQALDPQSITLTVTYRGDDVVVNWGGATRNADKARLLPVLLRRHPELIDLTDPDQPFIR